MVSILAELDRCKRWREFEKYSTEAVPHTRGTNLRQKQTYWFVKGRASFCRRLVEPALYIMGYLASLDPERWGSQVVK